MTATAKSAAPGDRPPATRSLHQLLTDWSRFVAGSAYDPPPPYDGPDVKLTQLTEDTRLLRPGGCFVARVRTTSDGHRWIARAITSGATLILAEKSPSGIGVTVPDNVIYWQVPDSSAVYAWLAAAWHGFPSQHLTIIGITGTDGKSSTANILYHLLHHAGLRVGLLSTIRAIIGEQQEPLALHVTTPEAPAVQAYLRRMVDAGLTHCILETTSHSLAQQRVTGVLYDVAVVTNITHEHLDYHGSYEAYFAAKARLFEMTATPNPPNAVLPIYKHSVVKTAVLNRDDSSYTSLNQIAIPRQIDYALRQPAVITASAIDYSPESTSFRLHLPDATLPITTPLGAEFNVYNMLAATATATAVGLDPTTIRDGLAAVPAIDGRMERIHLGQPFLTIVDFAHTPRSLELAIAAARQMTSGRVITVFGSAGLRDVAKRRLMANISVRDADLTILTAEDPRTESLDDILDAMTAAATAAGGVAGKTFWRIADRGRAIYFALTLARPGDLVLICGKGHEQSMCFGVSEYPWDDRHATRQALAALLNGRDAPNLGLPTF